MVGTVEGALTLRDRGVDGAPLLPAYVAETWEQAVGASAR